MADEEKRYSSPEEMDRILALALSEDSTISGVTIGWLVRQAFEANCTFDAEEMKSVIDPAFKRKLDAHIEWMESFKSDPIQERRENLITAINTRQSDG